MAWPFDNQGESVLPIDYGVQKFANYANNAMGNNQNIRKYPDRKLQTWPRYDINNTSALLPNNQNNSGLQWWMNADRGRWPVSGTNVMPDNLTQDLGAATYRGPLPSVVDESRIPGRIQEELPTKKGFQLPNFGITGILQGLKDQFEYRPATETAWDPNTGQFVSAEEQDKMNALGGYYSDAARNQRRQRARVINMIKRRDADKGYSEKNLQRLIDLGYGPKETITTTSVGDNINQGGGGYDRGYTQSQRAGVEAYHGRGGGKEMMSQGGRIGLYAGGDPDEPTENIFEVMQDQGIPFGEQVEAEITEEQKAMVLDMLDKGIDMETIISITGVGQEDIMTLIGGTSMAPDQDQGLASLV
jgi:hypothetical protein